MVINLTRDLVRLDSCNPPGHERDCARLVGTKLEAAGFNVTFHEFAEGRTSLIARVGGNGVQRPLCLTGHLDVVPTGAQPWERDPFAGELDGERIHGRGTSDMKAGVAAMVVAAMNSARRLAGSPGLTLVLTAGEETGCEGALDLARRGVLGHAGAIVVGEPTSNQAYVGHKGCFRFRCVARGVTAHSSMPELGENAIYKAARAITALEHFDFADLHHPIMGHPTLVVSQMQAGMNINSVPDRAVIGVDVRTIPGQDSSGLRSQVQARLGPDIELEPIIELPSVFTSPADDWVQAVFERAREIAGAASSTRTAPYFTDAAVLGPAYGAPPTVILGPGEPHLAHQTNEHCLRSRIDQAVELYERLIDDWVRASAHPREA